MEVLFIFLILFVLFCILCFANLNQREEDNATYKSSTDIKLDQCMEMLDEMLETLQNHFFEGRGGSINIAIKGLYYREQEDIIAARSLYIGKSVYLREEPENSSDPNAVAVYTESGNHIGYVPKEYAQGIKNLIKQGLELNCTISKNTGGNIPYLYMDVSYKSKEQKEFESNMEQILINNLKSLGLDETEDIRRRYSAIRLGTRKHRTIDIVAKYRGRNTFDIIETVEYIDNSERHKLNYYYEENIGHENYENARLCEKANDVNTAISLYEMNLNIEECISKSAERLSVLYKKVHRINDIIPMLDSSIDKAKQHRINYEVESMTKRKEQLLSSPTFLKQLDKSKKTDD
ncbi:MAG TPA: HIRAN domain-containing protein [Candidatus Bacteroides pullicola]|uniref:HIRAN domain-containing protein n=1 Tax=Candidatus Bacteroides pullicola TaxID=2838475 RepID=A0A9D1ZI91_9BACE|nr:HIRAN domain-containing protein [Candidatus Bacteroides pullicola]